MIVAKKTLACPTCVLYNPLINNPTHSKEPDNSPSDAISLKEGLKKSFQKGLKEGYQKHFTKWVKIKIMVSLALIALLGGLLAYVGVGIEMHPYQARILEVDVKDKTDTYNWKKWVANQFKKSSSVKFVILEGPFEGKELGMTFYDEKESKLFQQGDIVLVDAGQGRISWFTPTSNMRSLKETATDEKN